MNELNTDDLFLFHQNLSNLVRSIRRRYRQWMAENGFTHYYYRLLHHVNQDNPPKLTDLSRRSIIKKSNITKLIDKLESKKLIRRFQDPNDRRILRVELTPEGLKVREEMIQQEKKFVEAVYKDIPTEKLPAYIEMVVQIKAYLKNNLGEDANGTS